MTDAQSTQHKRQQLLDESRAAHEQLVALIAPLDDDAMTRPIGGGEWSVKDHLAHITWWEQRIIRTLRDGAPDLAETLGAVDISDTDQINAAIFAANRDRPLADVRGAFDASYQEMLTLIETLPDETFVERYDWLNGNAGGHYDEHLQMLRGWLADRA